MLIISCKVNKTATKKFEEMYPIYEKQIKNQANKYTGLHNYDTDDVFSIITQCLLKACMTTTSKKSIYKKYKKASFKTIFWKNVHQFLFNLRKKDKCYKRYPKKMNKELLLTNNKKVDEDSIRKYVIENLDSSISSLDDLEEKGVLNKVSIVSNTIQEEESKYMLKLLTENFGIEEDKFKLTPFQLKICKQLYIGFYKSRKSNKLGGLQDLKKKYGANKIKKSIKSIKSKIESMSMGV